MPKKKAAPAKADKQLTKADLDSVPQAMAAYVTGVPIHRLRDHPELEGRNGDGTWRLPELCRGLASSYKPASLEDDEVEVVLKAIGDGAADVPAQLVDGVARIARRYGPAGLAAIGHILMDEMNAFAAPPERRTEATIRADAESQVWDFRRQQQVDAGESVHRCRSCGLYRWGTTWKKTPRRPGLVEVETVCERCMG